MSRHLVLVVIVLNTIYMDALLNLNVKMDFTRKACPYTQYVITNLGLGMMRYRLVYLVIFFYIIFKCNFTLQLLDCKDDANEVGSRHQIDISEDPSGTGCTEEKFYLHGCKTKFKCKDEYFGRSLIRECNGGLWEPKMLACDRSLLKFILDFLTMYNS